MDEKQINFSVDEINEAWSQLLSQYIMTKITLEKSHKSLEIEIEKRLSEIASLKLQLNDAQLLIYSLQGKEAIDG